VSAFQGPNTWLLYKCTRFFAAFPYGGRLHATPRRSVCPYVRLSCACEAVPFTENARYTMLMCRLTGGSPPLQRPARSNRLAVLACVRFQGGPLSSVMPTCLLLLLRQGWRSNTIVRSVCLSVSHSVRGITHERETDVDQTW